MCYHGIPVLPCYRGQSMILHSAWFVELLESTLLNLQSMASYGWLTILINFQMLLYSPVPKEFFATNITFFVFSSNFLISTNKTVSLGYKRLQAALSSKRIRLDPCNASTPALVTSLDLVCLPIKRIRVSIINFYLK